MLGAMAAQPKVRNVAQRQQRTKLGVLEKPKEVKNINTEDKQVPLPLFPYLCMRCYICFPCQRILVVCVGFFVLKYISLCEWIRGSAILEACTYTSFIPAPCLVCKMGKKAATVDRPGHAREVSSFAKTAVKYAGDRPHYGGDVYCA